MARYLVVSGALLTTYLMTALTGAAVFLGPLLAEVALIAGLSAVVIGTRRYHPASRWPWFLVVAMLLTVVGTVLPSGVLAGTAPPPSIADIFYLLSYAVAGCGLVTVVRRRTPASSLPALLDAGIISVSAGLLSWIYLIDPILGNADVSLPTRLVAAAYPLADLMIAAFGVRLLLDGGPKSVAVYCLTGYMASAIVPDTLNAAYALAGQAQQNVLVSLSWMVNSLLLGASGMHPSMRDVDAPSAVITPELGPMRLTALALASLLAPAALMVQYVRGAPTHVPLICVSCGALFLMVIGRLAGLVAIQRRMAVTDMLTGLPSRRYFENAMADLSHRHRRRLAVLLLDIDHFKRINDAYGHDGGDRVLREVAQRLSRAVRPGDIRARYGGEEFVVLLPDTSPRDAQMVADRILSAIGEHPVAVRSDAAITVTVSIGLACLPADVIELDQLTHLADQMLYRAKGSGRNQIAAASDPITVADVRPERSLRHA